MSSGKRLGLIVLAVAVAAAAFVALRPDDDDDQGASRPADRGVSRPSAPAERPTATIETRPEHRISLRDHATSGTVQRIEVEKGELVRITVDSDEPDQLHLHGYDIERKAAPGQPARFSLRADVEGVFELESHAAEDAGREPVVARLVVEPS